MKLPSVSIHVAAAMLCLLTATGAQAQPIFRGQDITEENLIEALTPAPDEIRTRSIRVERDQPEKKAGASLLITFVTNSAALTTDAQAKLDIVARALQAEKLADFSFAVEGHADPRGRPDYNLRLSQARAESVVDYLTAHHQVKRSRLRPIGKGDTELANTARPTAPENRRVTILTVRE